jgi:hypothetical protein
MSRHVSTERLARFRDGDRHGLRDRRIEAHLQRCARCQAASAELAAVPGLLAAADLPRIPAHLAARIESALAAESAQRTRSAQTAGEAAGRPGHARRRARPPAMRRTPALRVLAAAAAVVVVAGGAYELVAHLGGSSSGGTASSSAGAPARQVPRAGAFRPTLGAPNQLAYGQAVPYRRGGGTATIRPVWSGTAYQAGPLARQAAATLAKAGRPAAVGSGGLSNSAGPDAVGGLTVPRPAQLARCLSRVAAGGTVLLVDLANFDGAPATIIVTAASGPASRQVWVVGSGCSGSASDVLAHRPLRG